MKLFVYGNDIMSPNPAEWGNVSFDLYLAENRAQALELVQADLERDFGRASNMTVVPERLVEVDTSKPGRLCYVYEKDYND